MKALESATRVRNAPSPMGPQTRRSSQKARTRGPDGHQQRNTSSNLPSKKNSGKIKHGQRHQTSHQGTISHRGTVKNGKGKKKPNHGKIGTTKNQNNKNSHTHGRVNKLQNQNQWARLQCFLQQINIPQINQQPGQHNYHKQFQNQ